MIEILCNSLHIYVKISHRINKKISFFNIVKCFGCKKIIGLYGKLTLFRKFILPLKMAKTKMVMSVGFDNLKFWGQPMHPW
jgi:hypothetical protein